MLVDLTRCIGCRACENACLTRRGFSGLPIQNTGSGYGKGEGRLTYKTWTFIDHPEHSGGSGATKPVPVKRQCMHCLEPACASACPVAALVKTPNGPVIYRESRCIGCRYCMMACPFNIPRYEWSSGLTPKVGKCDFCSDRVTSGLEPACVQACPTGALKFGTRSAILGEARGRRSARPERYVDLYGDEVVGGTSWIYLSDIPLDRLGFRKDLPNFALPSLTWKALSRIPFVVVGLGIIMAGIYRLRAGNKGD